MERKRKRRTDERIRETALSLFNRYGEPSVTISSIAAELGISSGNLYYHYRTKEKIVEDLFSAFCAEIERTLATPERRPTHVEDVWLFLHLVFESIFKYRFLYRDLNELLSRHRVIETRFKRILAHKAHTAVKLLNGLVEAGVMNADPVEIRALAENMTVLATYWLSYELALHPRIPQDGATLARGVFHVMSVAKPHLSANGQALFDHLAVRYLKPEGQGNGEKTIEMDQLPSS